MENILLFGAGLHATYCIEIIEKEGRYNIIGFIDSVHDTGSELYGYPVVGKQEDLKETAHKYNVTYGLITIGDNWSRKHVYEVIINQMPDFIFINAIHPSAIISNNIKIGIGNVIMAGCIVSTNTTIGDFCFLGSGAQLNHDGNIGNYVILSAGTITGGKVTIGNYSSITLGVIILDRINIGCNTVIGSGSLVTKDMPDNILAYGNPAKIIRKRTEGEKFLKSN